MTKLAHNAQFIAYGEGVRAANPNGDGTTITVRPEIFVRYYAGIKILSVEIGGRTGTAKTVAVHLDPESIGLSEKITGYISPDDKSIEYLQQAQQEGSPVHLAIETARRKKRKSDKSIISPLIPIHALRGAKDASGTRGDNMLSVSGDNISNVIAFVDGRTTSECKSNVNEWPTLVDNKDGSLAPEGWLYLGPTEGQAWDTVGAIVPAGAPAPAGQNTPATGTLVQISGEQLATLIRETITRTLAGPECAEHGESTNRRPSGRRFDEGKRWDARTSDGRVNIGSYAAGNALFELRWLHTCLVDASESTNTDWLAVAKELLPTLLDLADKVQVSAYGGTPVPVKRMASSYSEVLRNIHHVILTGHPLPVSAQTGQIDEDLSVWVNAVGHEATDFIRYGMSVTGEHLAAANRPSTNTGSIPQQSAASSTNDHPVVNTAISLVTKDWANRDALQRVFAAMRENGTAAARVATAGTPDAPVFKFPAPEGAATFSLGDLVASQLQRLNAAAPAAAPAVPAAGPEAAAPTQAPTNGSGYSREVAEIAGALRRALTIDDVRAAYSAAKNAGVLAETITVTGGNGNPVTVQPATYQGEGATKQPVHAVIDSVRKQIEAKSAAQPVGIDEIITAGHAAKTDADVTALIDAATAQGLMDTTVSVDGGAGPLGAWLSALRGNLTK